MNLIEKVFGTHSERELKLIRPIVDKILGIIRAVSQRCVPVKVRRWYPPPGVLKCTGRKEAY